VEYLGCVRYHPSVSPTKPSRLALAAEAWRPMIAFFFQTGRRRAEIFERFGLTPGDAKALWALDAHDGRPMRELAKHWSCDASNATWIVDRLEQAGLAERRPDPRDRRVKLVVMTERGAEVKTQVLEAMLEPPPELMELTRADLEALRDATAKLPVDLDRLVPEPGQR
jgi:DNA-binding MarR family transcriptional regulator